MLMVVEILLCLQKVERVETLRNGFLRPVIYIIIGIISLGVAATLGIVAGALLFLAAAFWLIMPILMSLQ
jgi:hypothetical protein